MRGTLSWCTSVFLGFSLFLLPLLSLLVNSGGISHSSRFVVRLENGLPYMRECDAFERNATTFPNAYSFRSGSTCVGDQACSSIILLGGNRLHNLPKAWIPLG